MLTYTIIGGVNGVGKSTFIGAISAVNPEIGQIIDPDKFITEQHGNMIDGMRKAAKAVDFLIEAKESFAQETTLSGRHILNNIIRMKQKGFRIRLHYIGLNTADECLKRIKNRVKKGGHDIPEKLVRKRFEHRFDDLGRILPFCDEVTFLDNENGFIKVGEYSGGAIRAAKSDPPDWFIELIEYCRKITEYAHHAKSKA